jgi:hypothetical protein
MHYKLKPKVICSKLNQAGLKKECLILLLMRYNLGRNVPNDCF